MIQADVTQADETQADETQADETQVDDADARRWTVVCDVADVPLEGGVAALVDSEAVAIFRTYDGDVHALGNLDPFSDASVLSRGIVGSRGEVPVVSSPMYKQAFDLRTGRCLDDDGVSVPSYDVAVVEGRVLVGGRRPVGEP